MANTILTHQMVARKAAAILSEEMSFVSNVNHEREADIGKETLGYKSGETVKVALPPASKVYSGSSFAEGGSADYQQETYKDLVLSTQKHVPLTFTTVQKVMELTRFEERFLRPAMKTLAAVVQADMVSKAYKQIPGLVGSAGTVPTSMKTYSQAMAYLDSNLCPVGNRTCLISPTANVELLDESRKLFNPVTDINKMYRDGILGHAMGSDFYSFNSLAVHTNGADVTGVTVYGATQSGSTLIVDHVTSGATIKAGSVFTIADVYAVHPLTGENYGSLQQFTVTADAVADGSSNATLHISPSIDATAPGKTVSALPANGAALTFVGSASTGYRQGLMFHRDSIMTAFAPLPIIASCTGYTATVDGISVRVMTFGDGKEDLEHTRIDVLYADPVLLRWGHAVRITE